MAKAHPPADEDPVSPGAPSTHQTNTAPTPPEVEEEGKHPQRHRDNDDPSPGTPSTRQTIDTPTPPEAEKQRKG